MIFTLLLACDDTLFGVLPDTASAPVEQPDYTADVDPIWLDACAGCHTNGGAQGSLTLDEGAALLVGVPSTEAPSVALVAPGSPDDSWIWLKLTGEQSDGSADHIRAARTELTRNQTQTINLLVDVIAQREGNAFIDALALHGLFGL